VYNNVLDLGMNRSGFVHTQTSGRLMTNRGAVAGPGMAQRFVKTKPRAPLPLVPLRGRSERTELQVLAPAAPYVPHTKQLLQKRSGQVFGRASMKTDLGAVPAVLLSVLYRR
jgi:hypothetical protein